MFCWSEKLCFCCGGWYVEYILQLWGNEQFDFLHGFHQSGIRETRAGDGFKGHQPRTPLKCTGNMQNRAQGKGKHIYVCTFTSCMYRQKYTRPSTLVVCRWFMLIFGDGEEGWMEHRFCHTQRPKAEQNNAIRSDVLMQDIYICASYKFAWTSTVNPLMLFFAWNLSDLCAHWHLDFIPLFMFMPMFFSGNLTRWSTWSKTWLEVWAKWLWRQEMIPCRGTSWVDCFCWTLEGSGDQFPLLLVYCLNSDNLHGWLLLGQTVKRIVKKILPLMHLELT